MKNLFPVLIFFIIALFLVFTWFKHGLLYGGAEVGLLTINPERWLEISQYVWWGANAPGQLIPHFVTGVPLYFIFYLLSFIGLGASHIQQLFFLTLLFLMGFGGYLFAQDILNENNKKYAIIAGLFYSFNAYTLVQVWHRFLYSTYLLAAVLPFLVLFWGRWIKYGNPAYLFVFLSINFLSSYLYGNLASVITVWLALTLISFPEIIFPWQGSVNAKKIGVRFLVGVIFWILTNFWWLYPTFSIAPTVLPQQHSIEDNLGTLVVISTQTIIPYLLQLLNPFYLFQNAELGEIYSNIIFKIIPWTISLIIFLGIVLSLKIKGYSRFAVVYILSLLLAKGAAIPFSLPFIFGLEHFYTLGVLRNPFEKIGILLPLFGAIVFAIGLKGFLKWGNKALGKQITQAGFIIIILALTGYSWPMLGGKVFGTKDLPVKVTVPENYLEANQWFREKKDQDGVILHLPFSGRDVVTYSWDFGYHGVDQNSILFTTLPSLSRPVGAKTIDQTLGSLTYIFTPAFEDKKQILKILQNFNVKYILLHKDIKWDDKDTYGETGKLLDPTVVEQVLDGLDFLQKGQQFGQLIIYKIKDEYFKPAIFVSSDIEIVYPGQSDILQILSLTDKEKDVVTPDPLNNAFINRSLAIFPDKKFKYTESSTSAMINKIENILTNPTASPIINNLLQIRKHFYIIGYIKSNRLVNDLILSTEKILTIYQQKLLGSVLPSNDQLSYYQRLLQNFIGSYSTELGLHMLFREQVSDTLMLHRFVLKQIGQINTLYELERFMLNQELLPSYKIDNPEFDVQREILKFMISSPGTYQLNSSKTIYDVRINGEQISSSSSRLNRGSSEISYQLTDSTSEVFLRMNGEEEASSGGRILDFRKNSTVNWTGRISIEKPLVFFFSQSYHPGWVLKLKTGNFWTLIGDHYMGNYYANAWYVEKIGEYDFEIEFKPQKKVNIGYIISSLTGTGIFVGFLFMKLRKKNV